jgi:hypothetical protein
MNQLDLEASTEGVDELIASNSEPMYSEDLNAMQEANKALPDDQYDDKITVLPQRLRL